MILLTPPFSENFDDCNKLNASALVDLKQARDCFDISYSGDCMKLYNEEYIEVLSPTVFETVEVYTSASSDQSDCCDTNHVLSAEVESDLHADSAISLDTLDTVSSFENLEADTLDTVTSFENLEPGTYTLDVLEPTDFDFDTVFTNTQSSPGLVHITEETTDVDVVASKENSTVTVPTKSKTTGETLKKPYKLKSHKNSSRKSPSPKCVSQVRNVSAREFLNNFTNDLRKTEESAPNQIPVTEDEVQNLSWLLDFKIASIFYPVERNIGTYAHTIIIYARTYDQVLRKLSF